LLPLLRKIDSGRVRGMGHTTRLSGTRSMLKTLVNNRHERRQYGEPTETFRTTYSMKIKYVIKMWTGFSWLTIA
jgi:hypothetical protein